MSQTQTQTQISSQDYSKYIFYRRADTHEILFRYYDIGYYVVCPPTHDYMVYIYEMRCKNCYWEKVSEYYERLGRLCLRHEVVREILLSSVEDAYYDPVTKTIRVTMHGILHNCANDDMYDTYIHLYVARNSITAYKQFAAFRYRWHKEASKDSFRFIMWRLLQSDKFAKAVDRLDFEYDWMNDYHIAPESPLIYCDKGPLLSLMDIIDRMDVKINGNKVQLHDETNKYEHNLSVYLSNEGVVIEADITGIRDFHGKITNSYVEVDGVKYDLVKLPTSSPFSPSEIVDAVLTRLGYEMLENLTQQQEQVQQ